MRKTKKYTAAVKAARGLLEPALLSRSRKANDALYNELESRGWFWDSDREAWSDYKPSASMFAGDDNTPTGVIRLRLMSHPADMRKALLIVKEALDTYGVAITEESQAYPNRRGPGLRVYLTGSLPKGRKETTV